MSQSANMDPACTALATAVASLDLLVFERDENGELKIVGDPPDWLESAFDRNAARAVEQSPFLSHFVDELAEPLWQGASGSPVYSGIWAEQVLGTESVQHFEATAIHDASGERLLVLKRLGESYVEVQQLTQRANENALEHRNLSREVQKKDVLLKCIVHDLNNPLGAVLLNLELLSRSADEKTKSSAALALEAARRQRSLIKSITEVFSSDLSRLGRDRKFTSTVAEYVRGAEHVVQMHLNEALRRSVSILLEDGLSGIVPMDRTVSGELEPFVRAVENLVLNALRYAPMDSTVAVALSAREDCVAVQVRDSGPGVEPDFVSGLFDPFTQGKNNRGSMGLGLYFCRMTIEQWGGTIAYKRASSGGACFVFTLPWAEPTPQKLDDHRK